MILVYRDDAQYKASNKKQCRPWQGTSDTPGFIFAVKSQSVNIPKPIVHTDQHWKVWTAIVVAKKAQKAIAAPLLGAYAYTEHDQPPKGQMIMSLRTREVRLPCHTEKLAKEQLMKSNTQSKPGFESCLQQSSNTGLRRSCCNHFYPKFCQRRFRSIYPVSLHVL